MDPGSSTLELRKGRLEVSYRDANEFPPLASGYVNITIRGALSGSRVGVALTLLLGDSASLAIDYRALSRPG